MQLVPFLFLENANMIESTSDQLSFLLPSQIVRFTIAAPGVLFYFTRTNDMLLKEDRQGTTTEFTHQFLSNSSSVEYNTNNTLSIGSSFSRVCPSGSTIYLHHRLKGIIKIIHSNHGVCAIIYDFLYPMLLGGNRLRMNHTKNVKGQYTFEGDPIFSYDHITFPSKFPTGGHNGASVIHPGGVLHIEPYALTYKSISSGKTLEWPHRDSKGVSVATRSYVMVENQVISSQNITSLIYSSNTSLLTLNTATETFAQVMAPVTFAWTESYQLEILSSTSLMTLFLELDYVIMAEMSEYGILFSTEHETVLSNNNIFVQDSFSKFPTLIIQKEVMSLGMLKIFYQSFQFSLNGDQLTWTLSDGTSILLTIENRKLYIFEGNVYYMGKS